MGIPDYASYEYLDKVRYAKPGATIPCTEEEFKQEQFNKLQEYKKAVDKQVGGQHYKKFKIQPAEFCHRNGIPYLEATAIKYLCRWRDKGGVQDLDKAIHFIELLKEFENVDS